MSGRYLTLVAAAVTMPVAKDLLNVNATVPVFGVPVTIIAAAAVGAACSLAFGDPIASRRSMFAQVFASTFFGACGSALATKGLDWKFAQDLPGAFALIVAGVLRLMLPTAIEKGKALINGFSPSFFKGKQND